MKSATAKESNTPLLEQGRKLIANELSSERRNNFPDGMSNDRGARNAKTSGELLKKPLVRKQSNTKVGGSTFTRWFSSSSNINETSLDGELKPEGNAKISEVGENVKEEREEIIDRTSKEAFHNTDAESKETHKNVNDEQSEENSNEKQSEATSSFDLNRTMHSNKPAYWQEIERQREEKEREKERAKAEATADG